MVHDTQTVKGDPFLQASFERQNKAKAAYLFSYVDSPPAYLPLKRDSLPVDGTIKIFPPDNEFLRGAAQFAAEFLADWPCPEEFSRPPVVANSLCFREDHEQPPWREGAFRVGELCDDDDVAGTDLRKEQHDLIDGRTSSSQWMRTLEREPHSEKTHRCPGSARTNCASPTPRWRNRSRKHSTPSSKRAR
ncbi:uncharacterized protein LOC142560898 [Dermacentor variabilis]|uniref:uncharacterized protein LOC142560898 n=1 Tax=Dermacentor variabilis TaxID=34621 RepID=UPI003F5C9619